MIKLNYLQYNKLDIDFDLNQYSLDSLEENFDFENLSLEFLKLVNYKKFKTFSFSKDGFLALLLELGLGLKADRKIAVSLAESQALIDACKVYESLGKNLTYLALEKNGSVNLEALKNEEFDYIFISSYTMDTFLKTNLDEVKELNKSSKIVSNASANIDLNSHISYFDNYKISGYFLSGIICFNEDELKQEFIGFTDSLALKFCLEGLKKRKKTSMKEEFLKTLERVFKDDLYYFVDNSKTLENSFHIALKDIKARELIRTLAFEDIYLSNGEGCSLGLSKPSRVIQAMGYDETTSRNALSFSFNFDLNQEQIERIVNRIYAKYLQIRSIN